MDKIQALNANLNLTGLLLPGAPFANALCAEGESACTAALPREDPSDVLSTFLKVFLRRFDVCAQPKSRGKILGTCVQPYFKDLERVSDVLRRFSVDLSLCYPRRYADIGESSASASKWDPQNRPESARLQERAEESESNGRRGTVHFWRPQSLAIRRALFLFRGPVIPRGVAFSYRHPGMREG